MGHREVELARCVAPRPVRHPAGKSHARLRPPGDFDVLPREGPRDAEPERLSDGLLAGEAGGIVLRRVWARIAVHALRLGEDTVSERRVALQRAPDAPDLDEVEADLHAPLR